MEVVTYLKIISALLVAGAAGNPGLHSHGGGALPHQSALIQRAGARGRQTLHCRAHRDQRPDQHHERDRDEAGYGHFALDLHLRRRQAGRARCGRHDPRHRQRLPPTGQRPPRHHGHRGERQRPRPQLLVAYVNATMDAAVARALGLFGVVELQPLERAVLPEAPTSPVPTAIYLSAWAWASPSASCSPSPSNTCGPLAASNTSRRSAPWSPTAYQP